MADKLRENIRHEIDIALNEIHRDYDKHIDHATDKIMELVKWDRMEVYGKVHESADERIENLEAENKRLRKELENMNGCDSKDFPKCREYLIENNRMREELDAIYDMTPDHKKVLEKFNKMKEALKDLSIRYERVLKIFEKHKWKYTDAKNFEQKMTFTVYSELVNMCDEAQKALGERKEIK